MLAAVLGGTALVGMPVLVVSAHADRFVPATVLAPATDEMTTPEGSSDAVTTTSIQESFSPEVKASIPPPPD